MEILEKQDYKCALTGWQLEFNSGGSFGGRNPLGCTIDRKNNELGYTIDNIHLVCCLANITRSKLTLERFKELCIAVAQKSNT